MPFSANAPQCYTRLPRGICEQATPFSSPWPWDTVARTCSISFIGNVRHHAMANRTQIREVRRYDDRNPDRMTSIRALQSQSSQRRCGSDVCYSFEKAWMSDFHRQLEYVTRGRRLPVHGDGAIACNNDDESVPNWCFLASSPISCC